MMKLATKLSGIIAAASLALSPAAFAQDTDTPLAGAEDDAIVEESEDETTTGTLNEEQMPPAVLAAAQMLGLISALDEDAQIAPNGAVFTIEDVEVTLVFDINAERMRLVTPIGPSAALGSDDLKRMMQANFDSALDARYAIANDTLWSTFIHPLTSLTQEDFISGIAQTITLVKTYGTTYSSGAMVFGGGDSNDEIQKLLQDRLEGLAKEI